jgi:hypothetical protein
MPLVGQAKQDWEFVSYRAKRQTEYWARIVDGDVTLARELDPEILAAALSQDKPFRSEGLTLKELWMLYIGVNKLTEEEEQRGKKKKKDQSIEPIKSRRIAGMPLLDKKGVPTGEYEYGVHFHDSGYLHFDQWLYARDQARKNLLWLNREVLGNTLVIERVHQQVCDQFVFPNFDGVYRHGYTIQELTGTIKNLNRVPRKWDLESRNYVPRTQTDIENPDNYAKISMTEDARDFFKSTIGRAHVIQLMLAIPDVSIIICCADNNLAEIFVTEIKKKFFLGAGADPGPIHLLFPEYVLRGVKGTSNEPLWTPARRLERTYPTLWADSIESTLSGLHCDFFNLDDVISNTNCQTPITREKMKNHIDTNMSVCDTWGWINIIGTRYFPDDYYGYLEAMSIEKPEIYGIKLFKRAAWYVKPEFAHIGNKKVKMLEEHMVNLTFPEHADWKFLQGKLRNEYTFRCQYLNEPVWGSDQIDMPLELLKAHLMNPMESNTLQGEIFVMGDMAKEAKKNSDYSTFVAMKIYRKRDPNTQQQDGTVAVVILEVVYGRWTQTETAYQLAQINRRWNPRRIQIENTGGLESFISYAIPEAFRKTGQPWYHIFWAPVEQGYDAKRNRIKGLEVLLKADRLYFAMGPWNDEAFTQLSQYTGAKSTRSRKDDIPDAMSFISRYLPSSSPKSPEQQQQEVDQQEKEMGAKLLKAQHDAMFGPTSFNYTPPAEPAPISSNPSGNTGLVGRLFGGNGMRA